MRLFLFLAAAFFLFSCGTTTKKKDKKHGSGDTSTIKKEVKVDKPYLKKRPEEFNEFFMLTDAVPFTGKVAKKKDVKNKDAVFNLDSKQDPTHAALKIRLPFFAFLTQQNKPSKFVAIIQAETLRGDTILGYKEANGLFGICKPRELEYFEATEGKVYQTLQ